MKGGFSLKFFFERIYETYDLLFTGKFAKQFDSYPSNPNGIHLMDETASAVTITYSILAVFATVFVTICLVELIKYFMARKNSVIDVGVSELKIDKLKHKKQTRIKAITYSIAIVLWIYFFFLFGTWSQFLIGTLVGWKSIYLISPMAYSGTDVVRPFIEIPAGALIVCIMVKGIELFIAERVELHKIKKKNKLQNKPVVSDVNAEIKDDQILKYDL